MKITDTTTLTRKECAELAKNAFRDPIFNRHGLVWYVAEPPVFQPFSNVTLVKVVAWTHR